MDFVKKGKACFDWWQNFFPDFSIVIAPAQVTLQVTNKCNLKCKHCSVNANHGKKKEIGLQGYKRMFNDFEKNKVFSLLLTGGEPLMRKDLFAILKCAVKKGFFTTMSTNATLIDKRTAKKLKKTGLQIVQVSLDGPEKIHNAIRGTESYGKTIAGIKNCVDAGLKVNINLVLNKINYLFCEDVIETAQRLNASSISITDCIPVGRAKNSSGFVLTKKEYENACSKIEKTKKKYRIKIISSNILKYSSGKKYGGKIFSRCGAGIWRCNINEEGVVSPCVLWPLDCGKYDGDFMATWMANGVFEKLRKRENLREKSGKTFSCGGCRARAFAYSGEIFGEDPRCLANANGGKSA